MHLSEGSQHEVSILRRDITVGVTAGPGRHALRDSQKLDRREARCEARRTHTLEAVATDRVGDRKVVGTCESGTKKIIYTRK